MCSHAPKQRDAFFADSWCACLCLAFLDAVSWVEKGRERNPKKQAGIRSEAQQ